MTVNSVLIAAPARLHMGFLDLSGTLGRQFGSIGVALDEPVTQLRFSAGNFSLKNDAVEKYLSVFCKAIGVSDCINIEIIKAIPQHVGLGSGTQMALAVGAGLNAFYDLKLNVREIAAVMQRGLRSGIGIGVFEQGGFVVDGGRGDKTITPPVLAQFNVPENWRFILVFNKAEQGLHGQQELTAFKALPPFPRTEVERLSYLLLMQALPAIAEQDLNHFGQVITELQRAVGQHFSLAQGGGIFTCQNVANAMAFLAENGATGIGQTSWGPTGFCLVENQCVADNLVKLLHNKSEQTDLTFKIIRARNKGAELIIN